MLGARPRAGHPHPDQRGRIAVFVIIGMVVVLGSIAVGYTMYGGDLMVLMKTYAFITVGAGTGALVVAPPPRTSHGRAARAPRGSCARVAGLCRSSTSLSRRCSESRKSPCDSFAASSVTEAAG
jgi:hypothetical protein